MNFENNNPNTQQQEGFESKLISLQEAMAEAEASYDSARAGEIQEQINALNSEESAKHDTALAQESTEDSNSPEKIKEQAQAEAITEEAKRTEFATIETRKVEDKVLADAILIKIQGGVEKKEDFSTVLSLEELSNRLGRMESYKDPIEGEVSIERLRQNVMEMNTDLGQAAGLIAQNGKYEGTPQQIVERVLAKLSNLPSSLQDVYRRVATEYINQKISETEVSYIADVEKLKGVKSEMMSLYGKGGYEGQAYHNMGGTSQEADDFRRKLKEFSDQDQQKLAKDFYEDTIGQNIQNNENAYNIYMAMRGTTFAKKFKELEDTRLKEAGYSSGFIL